jgi:hypothetical protein
VSDLVSRLLGAIEETVRFAREGCDPRAPDTGEHWQWAYAYVHDPRVDQPVSLDACREVLGDDSDSGAYEVYLSSIEEYPATSVGSLPTFAVSSAHEVKVGAARHIVRNDPSAVLRRCEADRRQVERLAGMVRLGEDYYDNPTVWDLVQDSLKDFADAYGITEEETRHPSSPHDGTST